MKQLRALSRIVGGGRFGGEHVESGGVDAARVKGFGKSVFVDERSAAGVDEYGRGFHAGEAPGVDHVACAVGQRAVERDDVGGCEEFVKAGFADSCGEAVGAFRCVGLDLHSECEGYAADGLADVAQPDYAECLSG
mgnify:FL=1